MKSIIQKEKECYLCGTTKGLENHHCVHGMNTEADKMLKRIAQKAFEKKWNHELWMLQFGRNYLDESEGENG